MKGGVKPAAAIVRELVRDARQAAVDAERYGVSRRGTALYIMDDTQISAACDGEGISFAVNGRAASEEQAVAAISVARSLRAAFMLR